MITLFSRCLEPDWIQLCTVVATSHQQTLIQTKLKSSSLEHRHSSELKARSHRIRGRPRRHPITFAVSATTSASHATSTYELLLMPGANDLWLSMRRKATTHSLHIRALRRIRKHVEIDTVKPIASAMVGARIDYYNSILNGIAAFRIQKLQRVQNTLARVVSGTLRSQHIKPILGELHWLHITYRIQSKLAFITFKIRTSQEPCYTLPNSYKQTYQPHGRS